MCDLAGGWVTMSDLMWKIWRSEQVYRETWPQICHFESCWHTFQLIYEQNVSKVPPCPRNYVQSNASMWKPWPKERNPTKGEVSHATRSPSKRVVSAECRRQVRCTDALLSRRKKGSRRLLTNASLAVAVRPSVQGKVAGHK